MENKLGQKGEVWAANLLESKGYKIKHKNWRYKKLELDLICERPGNLVIVEVKTRTHSNWESIEQMFPPSKRRRTVQAARAYIEAFDINLEVQFDLILVYAQSKPWTHLHLENVLSDALLE